MSKPINPQYLPAGIDSASLKALKMQEEIIKIVGMMRYSEHFASESDHKIILGVIRSVLLSDLSLCN